MDTILSANRDYFLKENKPIDLCNDEVLRFGARY
jgi:hypothetical protein